MHAWAPELARVATTGHQQVSGGSRTDLHPTCGRTGIGLKCHCHGRRSVNRMRQPSENPPRGGGARIPGANPPWGVVPVVAVAMGGLGLAVGIAPAVAGALAVAAAGVQLAVVAWWSARIESQLGAPVRQVIRSMGRFEAEPDQARRVALPIGGGALARSLARHWNEVAAHAIDAERDADARVVTLEIGRDRLRAVLETVTEGVLVFDPGGELVLSNGAARAMLGCGDRLLVGRRLEEFTKGDVRLQLRDALDQLIATRGSRRDLTGLAIGARLADATVLRLKGRDTWNAHGTVVVLRDVTRHVEISKVKDKFLSSISHELRTPLTSICSYAEILQTLVPGQDLEWPEFVRIIHCEGLRLAEMVDSVLDYVRMEAGEVQWRRVGVDLVETTRGVCDSLRAVADAARVTLDFDGDARSCPVSGDPEGLARAVRALVDNALKFVHPGGHVGVTVGREGHRVRVRVEDDGVGIPAHLRDDAFERFHQPRDHLTEKPDGLGLGLPTCRLIVNQHGGTIWCDDSPLGGARLQFVLPLARERDDGERPATAVNSEISGLAVRPSGG